VALTLGAKTDVVFHITRVSDGRRFMVLSSSLGAEGTFQPVILEDVTPKAGDSIGIEQETGSGSSLQRDHQPVFR